MQFIKRNRIWIVLVLLIVPIALRGLWFYYWFPAHSVVKFPDYASNTLPQPPISTLAPEQVTASVGKVVVVDFEHGNQFTRSEIDSFVAELTRRGARVEFASGEPSLATRLKYATAYVVFSPDAAFSLADVNLVRNFVNSGGRLIVFTDPTRGTSVYDSNTGITTDLPDADAANNLLAPFGISVKNDYLYNLVKSEGNFRNVLFKTFALNAVTAGLGQVAFYGAHSVEAADGTPLIVGDENTYSSLTDSAGSGRAAAALSTDGNVLVLGDFSFLVPPYNTVAPFAGLQNALLLTSTKLVISDTAPADGDLLVMGNLTPARDLLPYIVPFSLGLDDESTVVIPGFGTVSRTGIGLLLYLHTPARNTLIVLTDKPEDLPTMIGLLSSGDLSSCVIQNNIGVCSIGSGTIDNSESTGESTPAPVESPTSTPSG